MTHDHDGFSDSSHATRGGNFARWSAGNGWTDRDGCKAPSPVLVVGRDEILRRWQDGRPTDSTEKPLPDPDDLNAEIPQSEWEKGMNGEPRAPWQHHVVLCFVEPATAQKFIYASPTAGAHIADDQLNEQVATMRLLRGDRCLPLVELTERPMKTKYKMNTRPHFEVVGWKIPGGELPSASASQIEAPKPKSSMTLAAMDDVTEPTPAEIIDDEIPEIQF